MPAVQFARARRVLCIACLLGYCLFGALLRADEAPQLKPGLYDGAVGIKLDQIVENSHIGQNPVEMVDTSLREVIPRIEQMTGLQVWLDDAAFTDAGISITKDTPIPRWAEGETVSYLAVLLSRQSDGIQLVWLAQDGVLTLTTREKSFEHYVTRKYPLGDLLSKGFGSDAILDILQSSTSGPWDADEPGTGTLSLVGDQLYIRQTHHLQQEVAELLAGLRREDPIVLLNCSNEDLRLRKSLAEKTVSFEFSENTLSEVATRLESTTGAKFRLDLPGLIDSGLDEDTTLAARAVNLPLSVALHQMLMNVNGTALTVVVRNEECLITTEEAALDLYDTVLYRVGPWGMKGAKFEEFVAMLEQETSGPWDADEPGTGTLSWHPSFNLLVIRQTQRVHQEILEILRELRAESLTNPAAQVAFSPAAEPPAVAPSPAHVVHPAFSAMTTLTQSIRQQFAAVTWDGIADYSPLFLALLMGCAVGYYCRH